MKELFCISEITFRLNNNRKDINDFRSKHIGSDVLRYIKFDFMQLAEDNKWEHVFIPATYL